MLTRHRFADEQPRQARLQRFGLWLGLLIGSTAVPVCLQPVQSADVPAAQRTDIDCLLAVDAQGQGQAEALQAVGRLSKAGPDLLPELLTSCNNANKLAANWLRGVFETIAARAVKSQQPLPAKQFEEFVINRDNDPFARRLAYEWLLKVDATAADRLIPDMLQDPSAEFRRDAVARVLSRAQELAQDKAKSEQATQAFREALQGAVDDDQVQAIVTGLKEFGQEVDLQQHFGFLTKWQLIGPFDNTETKGFDVAYAPETELNFERSYPGKMGEVRWTEHITSDPYGVMDLAKELAPHKGAITYATTEFVSSEGQTVEVRLGTPNAWKLWVNGELKFARDEYHRGEQLDQYRVPVALKPGKNVLLLKICQNEQKEEWAQKWQYQLRICDRAGAAVLPAAPATSGRSQVGRAVQR
jgi:hypothetical protein